MKIKTTLTALSLLSVVAFGASAAESVDAAQASKMTDLGTVSVSRITGSPSDIEQAIANKAESKGATAYKIIGINDNNGWYATAQIYK
ncbi:hypothetical protein CH64_3039 [Yersinia rohdei]|uniref:Putative biofilm stress and motility protein A n=1 Tax=Yersinia rohdei TaxID=29485 RepID=A0A0U1HRP9_YERRO|nr:YdgH/BhsA/McbA-like domain containing protein [Yersinia rohdei]AJJ12385.1 hypothetical protein CH64_3039 [Yersinia rohdei]EEQ03863.1 hypothetical protein yrohd0001_6840 [Yersinia rohdei ATCC 43380]MDN0093042.1 DUF1471 domain-containing protein [Yersinia rohdei]OWF79536.1 hypothetical protein B4900_09945 [Yersinia rohdei]CNE37847.1 putative biofilm stress and motility protein A [Yersinia rohdei]